MNANLSVLVLAKRFNRAHKTILCAYDPLKCSDEFSRRNYEPRTYLDERGKLQRSITMTKDGFTMGIAVPGVILYLLRRH
jgi:phage regulator Rha-like protein